MYTQESVLELVGLIYDSACDPTAWPQLLETLRRTVGASGADLSYFDLEKPSASISHSNGIVDGAFTQEYLADFIWCDPFVIAGRNAGMFVTGTVGIGESVVTTAALKKTAFYNDFGKRHEYTGGLTAIISADGKRGSALNLCRPINHTFGDAELRLMRALVPHLQRALQMHDRMADLEDREGALHDALNRLETGAMLVGRSGRVLFVNDAARLTLAERDGLAIDGGMLSGSRPRDTRELRNLIGGAATTAAREGLLPGGLILVDRPSGRRALQVIVAPAPVRDDVQAFGRTCVVVFVTDPERTPARDVALTARVYGFSRAETDVARLLLRGQTVQEIARSLYLTANTVRFHLKQLFAKTGTHRQAEFVRMMLMNSPFNGHD
jgi:DNA-binding CsgD family transcriptional regulator